MAFKDGVLKIVTEHLGTEAKLDTVVLNASGIGEESNRDLVMRLEEELGVEIPDAEAEKLHTIQDIITYLDSTVKEEPKKEVKVEDKPIVEEKKEEVKVEPEDKPKEDKVEVKPAPEEKVEPKVEPEVKTEEKKPVVEEKVEEKVTPEVKKEVPKVEVEEPKKEEEK